jgi:hypothetical protein
MAINIREILKVDENNVCCVPFVIRGQLIYPEPVSFDEICQAYRAEADKRGLPEADIAYLKMSKVQVFREPVIDRANRTKTNAYFYQVFPLFTPSQLHVDNFQALVDELYNLPLNDVLDFIGEVGKRFLPESDFFKYGIELFSKTSMMPDEFIKAAFYSMPVLFSRKMSEETIENELSYNGVGGAKFMDGWVKIKTLPLPGMAAVLMNKMLGIESGLKSFAAKALGWMKYGLFTPPEYEKSIPTKYSDSYVRAMPTRQIHITAGNSPLVPFVSALRAMLTKGYTLLKTPAEATIPGILLALAMHDVNPDHPLTKNISILYWKGGDSTYEDLFFTPLFFDRLVIWGSPEAVASVQKRATSTYLKTVFFNPRYGLSFIGKEVFEGNNMDDVLRRAMSDVMISNQKACIASLVHYVEGTEEQALEYCKRLAEILAKWDAFVPPLMPADLPRTIRKLQRSKFQSGTWFINRVGEEVQSQVVFMPQEFNLIDHPMARTVIVRNVKNLTDCTSLLHPGVSTVGIYPEETRLKMRDYIAAKGVSHIPPLGDAEKIFPGMPHDGIIALSHLVEWIIA